MKILYLSRAQIPHTKAHVLQIHKMCDALQQNGAEVDLYHPWEPGNSVNPEQIQRNYNLSEPLTYRTVPALNIKWIRQRTKRLGFLLYAFSFCLLALFPVLKEYFFSDQDVVIYSRDRIFAYILLYLKPVISIPVFVELHELPESLKGDVTPGLLKRSNGIIVISQALKKDLLELGFSASNVLVEPDAADRKSFEIKESRESIRSDLGLPQDESLIGFTGNLYSYNGTDILLDVAEATEGMVVVVGGSQQQIQEFRAKKSERDLVNLRLEGYKPHREIPRYLKAFDVLLLPLQPDMNRTLKYCSPLKLFEYLMAGRPIVASDLPALREVLSDGVDALLVDPTDSRQFIEATRKLLNDSELADKLSQNARVKSEEYSWNTRANDILDFMANSLNLTSNNSDTTGSKF